MWSPNSSAGAQPHQEMGDSLGGEGKNTYYRATEEILGGRMGFVFGNFRTAGVSELFLKGPNGKYFRLWGSCGKTQNEGYDIGTYNYLKCHYLKR